MRTGLALQNGTHIVVQQGLALMVAKRRATYVRYRELWVLAATAHLVWICLNSGEQSSVAVCSCQCVACGSTHVGVVACYSLLEATVVPGSHLTPVHCSLSWRHQLA